MKTACPSFITLHSALCTSLQPYLLLHGLERFDAEAYVLVEFDAEFGDALAYVFAVDRARERLVTELLLDRRDLQVVEALRGPDERAGDEEAAQLVRGEESARELRVARDARVGRVAEDGADDALRVAAPAKDDRTLVRVLFGRGEHLVVEVVQQSDDAPLVNVLSCAAVVRGRGAHRGLDGEGVLAQALPLRVLAEQFPRFPARRH